MKFVCCRNRFMHAMRLRGRGGEVLTTIFCIVRMMTWDDNEKSNKMFGETSGFVDNLDKSTDDVTHKFDDLANAGQAELNSVRIAKARARIFSVFEMGSDSREFLLYLTLWPRRYSREAESKLVIFFFSFKTVFCKIFSLTINYEKFFGATKFELSSIIPIKLKVLRRQD